jgi:phosphohistidine swiveling domain-containing protein
MGSQATPPPEYDVFTERIPGDNYLWTSGFLNERFPQPVSPLGWALIRGLLEELAFRAPLRYLGYGAAPRLPITKLWRGHPYVNVAVFQILYRPFPDHLLPEDAARYFPGGDTRLRRQAPYPRTILDPRLWLALLATFLRYPGDCSPWHQDRRWAQFLARHEAAMASLEPQVTALEQASTADPGRCWQLIATGQALNGELLSLHRWSLTHADLWYTLLRRLAAAWLGTEAGELCARLVAGAPNKSLEVAAALQRLADLARRAGLSPHDLAAALSPHAPSSELTTAFAAFLTAYGHRSFSLDIVQAPFAADPAQVLPLIGSNDFPETGAASASRFQLSHPQTTTEVVTTPVQGSNDFSRFQPRHQQTTTEVVTTPVQGSNDFSRFQPRHQQTTTEVVTTPVLGRWRRFVFRHLLRLARRYMPLREDQRFAWQRTLAAQRRLFLLIGRALAERGVLASPDDIFFATMEEVQLAVQGDGCFSREKLLARRAAWVALQQEATYPRFLRGDAPLTEDSAAAPAPLAGQLRGRGVSPGLAQGPARLVAGPWEFARVQAGDVLVAATADPGWTPLFGRLAGLVLETGGLLSHAAVVAREYGLPAVMGVPEATRQLQDGQIVQVDGTAGLVTVVK